MRFMRNCHTKSNNQVCLRIAEIHVYVCVCIKIRMKSKHWAKHVTGIVLVADDAVGSSGVNIGGPSVAPLLFRPTQRLIGEVGDSFVVLLLLLKWPHYASLSL